MTCCLPDKTSEVATCGQGASCAGQCSALGASLCPSGHCTYDPGTCDIGFIINATEDQRRSQLGFAQARKNHEHSYVTLSMSDLKSKDMKGFDIEKLSEISSIITISVESIVIANL